MQTVGPGSDRPDDVTSTPGSPAGPTGRGKYLVLAAMIFAVSMTFIDMTIVSIAIPEIQSDAHLSATGVQWVINAYLLALAALFAFGGRLCDIVGHKKMVLVGVVVFAVASALNGFAPIGGITEAWLITFRAVQGLGAALMFPAALAIVVQSFPFEERGRAMAVFFGVAGGLTAVGPLVGGYLSEWTWRSIFWVNIPVAVIAVVLTVMAKPADTSVRARLDVRGLVLIVAGMGLSVLGFQQASVWGWTSRSTANVARSDRSARWHSVIASAAAVASSSRDALAMSMPVRSLTMVWKLSRTSSRPWEISGWYGV